MSNLIELPRDSAGLNEGDSAGLNEGDSAGLNERDSAGLNERDAARFAALALACVHRAYPSQIAHLLKSDGDALPPRTLMPAFYGCYDWHSAVHGHWLLARLARLLPSAPFAGEAKAALAKTLTEANIQGEVAYMSVPGREPFERPYGLAWLLMLAAELRAWDDADSRAWSKALRPLEDLAVARLKAWMPKLMYPVRSGEHGQTAFSFGLILDWARISGDAAMERLITSRIADLYLPDRDGPLAYEPSGHDFLSPCLGEADLVRRVLSPDALAAWLSAFLPSIPEDGAARGVEKAGWLRPAIVTDRVDGKLAHLDGLNLSRAWMLEGIMSGLPRGDRRLPALAAAAQAHREAGLSSVTGEHYAGGHWLGTFAVYLVTRRGIAADSGAHAQGARS
jgi:hypothetical protein